MIDPVTGAGLAQLLEEGVWYAFAAGSLFGAFILAPLAWNLIDKWQDYREQRQWSAS